MSAREAGRELDALIAERVMGYHGCGYYGPTKPAGMHTDYSRYDTPAEAFAKYREHWPDYDELTVEDVSLCHWKDGWGPLFVDGYSTDLDAAFSALDMLGGIAEIKRMSPNDWRVSVAGITSWGDTLPLAICRTLLAAIEVPA